MLMHHVVWHFPSLTTHCSGSCATFCANITCWTTATSCWQVLVSWLRICCNTEEQPVLSAGKLGQLAGHDRCVTTLGHNSTARQADVAPSYLAQQSCCSLHCPNLCTPHNMTWAVLAFTTAAASYPRPHFPRNLRLTGKINNLKQLQVLCQLPKPQLPGQTTPVQVHM